jgi:hypothetical protein
VINARCIFEGKLPRELRTASLCSSYWQRISGVTHLLEKKNYLMSNKGQHLANNRRRCSMHGVSRPEMGQNCIEGTTYENEVKKELYRRRSMETLVSINQREASMWGGSQCSCSMSKGRWNNEGAQQCVLRLLWLPWNLKRATRVRHPPRLRRHFQRFGTD